MKLLTQSRINTLFTKIDYSICCDDGEPTPAYTHHCMQARLGHRFYEINTELAIGLIEEIPPEDRTAKEVTALASLQSLNETSTGATTKAAYNDYLLTVEDQGDYVPQGVSNVPL